MTKSAEVVLQLVKNTKHPFRSTENQPSKDRLKKHERRRVREFLHPYMWQDLQQD
jgi:hypothetical protein